MRRSAMAIRDIIQLGVITAAAFLISGGAMAAVSLYDIAFVEMAGRPGHEGYFPIQGQPVQGTQSVLLARLIGPVGTAQARFVSEGGATLAVVMLSRPTLRESNLPEFYGSVVIPHQAFRISIEGVDATGADFHFAPATAAEPIRPSSLVVTLAPTRAAVLRNTLGVFYASIENLGATDTFSVSVTDSIGNQAVPEVSTINLSSGKAASIKISLTATTSPARLARYRQTVSFRGQSTGAENSAVVELPFGFNLGQPILVDIKPGSCLNRIQPKSEGVTPVAILASGGLDPRRIISDSVRIAGDVSPIRATVEDAGSPSNVDCNRNAKDGVADLVLFFETKRIAEAVRTLVPKSASVGRSVTVPISGRSHDGIEYIGYDDVLIADD